MRCAIGRRALLPGLTLLLLWGGTPAMAQEVTARTRAQEVLPAEVFAELDVLGGQLEREGIPADLVFSKALEGMAKRVPAQRIIPAVELFAGQLRDARALLGPTSGPPLQVRLDAEHRRQRLAEVVPRSGPTRPAHPGAVRRRAPPQG